MAAGEDTLTFKINRGMDFEQQAQSSWAKTQHGLAETTLSEVGDHDMDLATKRVGKLVTDRAANKTFRAYFFAKAI